ncbi:transcription termination factor 2 isoform X2 [Bradysia coprophila]|uniref:transcription termination factor 2 isoform X2 n=1 Tax=Bradysia coprophila TaxID=38358 RepID=UPI00187DCCA4|nr:transcription termination factor 2 isoform X2 [Bradysia coprophila]
MDDSILTGNSYSTDTSINIDETLNETDTDNEIIENSSVDDSLNDSSTKASLGGDTLDDTDAANLAESIDGSEETESSFASKHSGSLRAHDSSSKLETSEIDLSGNESHAARLLTSSNAHEDSSKFETSEINLSGNESMGPSKSAKAREDSSNFETSEINMSGNEYVGPSNSTKAAQATSKLKTQTKVLGNKNESAKPVASSEVFNIVDSDTDDDDLDKKDSQIYTIESSDESPDEDVKPAMKLLAGVKSEPGNVKEQQMAFKPESGARPIVKFENGIKSEFNIKKEMQGIKSESSTQSASSKLNASQLVDDVKPIHLGKTGMETFNYQQSMAVKCMDNLCKALDVKPDENKMADNPKQLKIELMPHQRIALTWMLWREEQKPKGGILADDMGLGKTMSMISLILAKLNTSDPEEDDQSSDSDNDDDDDRVEEGKSSWIAKGSSAKSYYYGGTLVVCPASIVYQWQAEVTNRVKKNSLAVVLHHGSNRETKPRRLSQAELVITTYGIVSSECDNQGALFSVKWERIILDEAHIIRNHTSKQSVACCRLKSSARWLLTGTPIQNKEMDLFPLLKFLKCRPFDDLSSFKMWISKTSSKSQERLNQVLQALLLRRTKEDLKQIGQIDSLPEKTRIIVPVQLSTDEMNVYQKVLIYSQSLFTEYLHQKETRNNFSIEVDRDRKNEFAQLHQQISKATGHSEAISGHHILILILRLRQICIHPCLINAMLTDGEFDTNDSDEENVPEVDLLEKLSQLKIGSADEDDETVSKASSKVLLRSNPVFDENRMSSKFQKIIEFITEKLIASGDKGIVVSQFATVLNMLGEHLNGLGIKFVTLTGQTKIDTRNDIVTKFNSTSSSVQVMLLSLTAGGVGLNLVGANHLFFIDPHWNPQLESQAQDRIYRIGQKKPVTIYKFLCDDTIERRIEKIQENKLQIANQVLTGAKRKTVKLTLDDMKSLFDL